MVSVDDAWKSVGGTVTTAMIAIRCYLMSREDLRVIVDEYDKLTGREQDKVTLDELCSKAQFDPSILMGFLAEVLHPRDSSQEYGGVHGRG